MALYEVIQSIAPSLAALQHVHAMWLEGSWATGANTEDSDIDVWLDVDDGYFDTTVMNFRAALASVGAIDWEIARGVYSESPRLQKHIFHLAGYPRLQRIELDLQEHSRDWIFRRSEHVIKPLFDKDGTIRWRD